MAVEIILEVDPAGSGTVTGAGTYDIGSRVTILAVPSTGYEFDGWYDEISKITSSLSYSFTVQEEKTYTAKFIAGPERYLNLNGLFYLKQKIDDKIANAIGNAIGGNY